MENGRKNSYMKLVIIGNGFDCAHNINTQYKYFRDYLKEENLEEYEFLRNLFGNNFDSDEFWSNFENSLKYADFSKLDEYTTNKREYYQNQGISEEEIENIVIEQFEKYIFNIHYFFCKWIKKINNEEMEKVLKKDIEKYFDDSIILSFNYTSTIEKIYNKNCYHIHGYIDNVNVTDKTNLDNIILGRKEKEIFARSLEDDSHIDIKSLYVSGNGKNIPLYAMYFIEQRTFSTIKENQKILEKAYPTYEIIFTKKSNSIINNDYTGFFTKLKEFSASIDEIIVMGHSISEVDIEYYKEIVCILSSNINKIKWIVSEYNGNGSELRSKLNQLCQINEFEKIKI